MLSWRKHTHDLARREHLAQKAKLGDSQLWNFSWSLLPILHCRGPILRKTQTLPCPLEPWKVAKRSKTRWNTGAPTDIQDSFVLWGSLQSLEAKSGNCFNSHNGWGWYHTVGWTEHINTLYQKCTKMVKFVILFLWCTSSHQLFRQHQYGKVLSSRVDFGSKAIRDPIKGNKHPSRNITQVYVHQQGTQPSPG